MDVRQRKQIFINFLTDNNCCDEYMKNHIDKCIAVWPGISDSECMDKLALMLTDENPNVLFSLKAFIWSKTSEGHDYWDRISTKWHNKFIY